MGETYAFLTLCKSLFKKPFNWDNFTPDTSAVNPNNRGFTCFVVKTNSRDLRVFGVKFWTHIFIRVTKMTLCNSAFPGFEPLSWIQVLNCQNCNQCLKCHKSPGLSCAAIVSVRCRTQFTMQTKIGLLRSDHVFSSLWHSWKKAGSQDPGSFDFFGQN